MVHIPCFVFKKSFKSDYHGLPFTHSNYQDIISGISIEWAGENKKIQEDRKKITFFYVDAKYDFEKFTWYSG